MGALPGIQLVLASGQLACESLTVKHQVLEPLLMFGWMIDLFDESTKLQVAQLGRVDRKRC